MGVVLTVFLFLQKGFNRLTFCSIMPKFMAGEWRSMLLAETAQFMSLPAFGLGFWRTPAIRPYSILLNNGLTRCGERACTMSFIH